MGCFLTLICKKSEANSFKAEEKKKLAKKPKQIQYLKSSFSHSLFLFRKKETVK